MAIIHVNPATPGGINGAVNAATTQPGDVILVADGVYHEQVTIPGDKDFIRIIAESRDAILDGQNTLGTAFELTDATGVEINGFTIRNYTAFGINVSGGNVTGGFNRIVGNRIKNIQSLIRIRDGTGIQFLTNGNLAWGNDGKRFGETLLVFDSGSESNWAIQNESSITLDDGMDLFGQNHAVIGNRFSKANFSVIFAPTSTNSLVLDNKLFESGDGFNIDGPHNVVIHNHIFDNLGPGILLFQNANNTFIADHLVERNAMGGVEIFSDVNIIQQNAVRKNTFNGIVIKTDGNDNLILRNRLEDNTPRNIVDNGTDNTFIQNKES